MSAVSWAGTEALADKVCKTSVPLEDSSKVVNFLNVLLGADDPSDPVVQTSHHPSLHMG